MSLKQIDDNQFACSSAKGLIHIFDSRSLEKINTLYGHVDSVTSLTLLNNGYLASTSLDRTVLIWDLLSSKVIQKFNPFDSDIYAYGQLSTNVGLVCGQDKSLYKWDLKEPEILFAWEGIFTSSECYDILAYNDIIVLATGEAYAKLINSTSNEFYLSFSTTLNDDFIYTLELVKGKLKAYLLNCVLIFSN